MGHGGHRFLPTAGLGGIGLTLWALRRAGLSSARATSTLLTFLVLLYVVFPGALTIAGLGAPTGQAGPDTLTSGEQRIWSCEKCTE